MLGFSYGEIFLLLGATAALIGPKDLPRISRTAGRFAGHAIGYVQLARGQFESVMQQSQAQQVHKELQDTMAQLEAIRHEIRTISFLNPGPLTRRLVDNLDHTSATNGNMEPEKTSKENILATTTSKVSGSTTSGSSNVHSQTTAYATFAESTPRSTTTTSKDSSTMTSDSSNIHSQATAYARLAESTTIKSWPTSSEVANELTDEPGLLAVLPVSAESAGLLPNRKDDINGSDIVLEAIVEAEVARNAKDFFSQPQNQIKPE